MKTNTCPDCGGVIVANQRLFLRGIPIVFPSQLESGWALQHFDCEDFDEVQDPTLYCSDCDKEFDDLPDSPEDTNPDG
jgi:hypothetical protein